jgi:hypothetical protein
MLSFLSAIRDSISGISNLLSIENSSRLLLDTYYILQKNRFDSGQK